MVRLKNRYIVIEINPETSTQLQPLKINETSLNNSIQNKVQQLHGDFGSAAIRSGFRAKYCNELTRIAVVRCRHGPHKLVTSALPFVTLIDSYRISINVLYVGATLRQCFNFVRLYQQRRCDEYCASMDSEEGRNYLRQALLDFKVILNAIGN